jgi:hypothetical protein
MTVPFFDYDYDDDYEIIQDAPNGSKRVQLADKRQDRAAVVEAAVARCQYNYQTSAASAATATKYSIQVVDDDTVVELNRAAAHGYDYYYCYCDDEWLDRDREKYLTLSVYSMRMICDAIHESATATTTSTTAETAKSKTLIRLINSWSKAIHRFYSNRF